MTRPPPTHVPTSLRKVRDSRWTPLIALVAAGASLLTAAVPLGVAWLQRDRDAHVTAEQLSKLHRHIDELERALASAHEQSQRRAGELQDELDATQHHARGFEDAVGAGMCSVGVAVVGAWECRPGDYQRLPKPHARSNAPPIQIRARVPPMPE